MPGAPRRPHIATIVCDWRGDAETGTSRSECTITKRHPWREKYGEVVICELRLWQQGPWEDISAGEWQRRGMMWRSLRAAPIAMLFAGMASRLRARSATFTSRMSTSLTIRHMSGEDSALRQRAAGLCATPVAGNLPLAP
jgi:hypothetical protein